LDPAGKALLLTRDCSDEELGTALLNALAASRMLTLKQAETFFAVAELQERYKAWVAGLMQHYKLKTKKALFTGMDNCHVTEREGVVSISPNAHQRLEGWVRTKSMNLPTLTVAANASAEDIGARLREAFSHCIGRDWGG